ncbi:MAG: DUF86 domain-containing protein [Cyanobacteria bacterium M_surface_10_m2_179]|nr:DUF86 domain-containing protein [Cyanobacteria bacterium M_surface_10_m2_179]
MQRDPRAYLLDILEAAAAIKAATATLSESDYCASRLIRSAVEREFIIIGEALRVISQRDPDLFAAIPEARQIIDFRNLLTHEYLKISHRVVWGPSRAICLRSQPTAQPCGIHCKAPSLDELSPEIPSPRRAGMKLAA